MKFLIVTHVLHSLQQQQYYGYAPYVREMNIWLQHSDSVLLVAPMTKQSPTAIDSHYEHPHIEGRAVPQFDGTTLGNSIKAIFKIPSILVTIFKAMQEADHIHLRCPGNMGLLACLLQIGFPSKTKTAKYAGNWDPKAQQPWTYRLQKWILSHPFLTRNMQVLVYGHWQQQSQNIKAFFTATYSEVEPAAPPKIITTAPNIRLLFVGSLLRGKNPLYAIQLVEHLQKTHQSMVLEIYGDGPLRQELESYVSSSHLEAVVCFHGNQNQEVLKKAYQESHFVVLPSQSEGWPKAIAEGMFWGCVPLATPVSCVPDMLDAGQRGILLQMNIEKDSRAVGSLLQHPAAYEAKSAAAQHWSRSYTLERFEAEIQKLLQV